MGEHYFSLVSKKQKKTPKKTKFSKGNVIAVTVVVCVVALIGYFAMNSLSPVNSNGIVFAPTTNISLKAVKSSQGTYHFQHTKGGKSLPSTAGSSPPLKVAKGNLIDIRLINEDKNEPGNPSKHNLNIDEFNVHTKDLTYFQSDSVLFLANKTGTFTYYCSIHPEMKGTITITN